MENNVHSSLSNVEVSAYDHWTDNDYTVSQKKLQRVLQHKQLQQHIMILTAFSARRVESIVDDVPFASRQITTE